MNRYGVKQIEQNTNCRTHVATIWVPQHILFYFFCMFKTFHNKVEKKKTKKSIV